MSTPYLPHVPYHACLSLSITTGSERGGKCEVYKYIDTHVHYGVLLSGFRHSWRYQIAVVLAHSTVIPSSSLGTASVKSCRTHLLKYTDCWVTPLSSGTWPARAGTQIQTHTFTHRISPNKADSSSQKSIIITLSPDLWSSYTILFLFRGAFLKSGTLL